MKWIDQFLDFCYVIIQRRLSGARCLMGAGLKLFAASGIGSLALQLSHGDYSFVIDTASDSRGEVILMIGAYFGLLIFLVGVCLEIYALCSGDAAVENRSKSIDLRSLDGAAAPTLCSSFKSTIEPGGIHDDLFLCKGRTQTISDWLEDTRTKLEYFHDKSLQKLNGFEPNKPLALGAIAHVPHCFILGYLIGNKRLVNYYCWNRNSEKNKKARWIDCRDVRTRGQQFECSEVLENQMVNDVQVSSLGISVEISFVNDLDYFLQSLSLDRAITFSVDDKYVGNMFSDVEQSKFVESLRNKLNNTLLKKYPNLTEIHITSMAQSSLIMRIGAEFNQNHLNKDIYIHHYDGANYPWALKINQNKDIEFIIK